MGEINLSAGLKALQAKKNITAQRWSELSGVPYSTLSRVLRDGSTDTSFQTIVDMVVAISGSLDELVGLTSRADIPDISRALVEQYEHRIASAKASEDRHYDNACKDKQGRTLTTWLLFSMSALVIIVLVLDILITNAGWIIR